MQCGISITISVFPRDNFREWKDADYCFSCVDILLQNMMCSSNVDIITLNWMETQKQPFPDFSINHQCPDFETLLEWRKDNSVNMGKFNDLVKPKGVKEIPAPKEYYKLFGEDDKGRVFGKSHD